MAFLTSRKALLFVLAVFLVGGIYRTAHFYVTGFYVPDEWGYAYVHLGNIQYQGRYFFQLFNSLVLPHNPDQLAIAMPFYFIFWLSIGILSAYGVMKLLYDERTITKTLLLSLTLPVFLLFSVAILSELPAFALSMLGIYLTVWFWKKGNTSFRYLIPFLVALLFVAANFTRADFIVFQLLGFIPFLVAEAKKTNVRQALLVSLLFIGPAVFFLYFPFDTGSAIIPVTQIAIFGNPMGTPPPIGGEGGPPRVSTPPAIAGGPLFPGHSGAFNPSNMVWVFIKGMLAGWNPVVLLLVASSFFLLFHNMLKKEKNSFIVFWLAFLALATFGGAAFIYSSVTTLPLSTAIRYAYDSLPAYFLLAPIILSRVKKGRSYGLIIAGLIVSGLVAVPFYQGALQSGLGESYPYLKGNQSFLTLDYRTPYAQMRDYFHANPASQYIVVGEPKKGYFNMTYDWKFTPGISDLNVIFYPYWSETWFKLHGVTSFYLYLEPQNFNMTHMYGSEVNTIYESPSFYFAKVSLP